VTWLIWRQYRTSAAISAALLAAFAALVIFTGLHLAAQFHTAFGSCLAANTCRFPNDDVSLGGGPVGFIIEFTLAVPALLGMFLGAPLVAREIETGTGQFAWTQAVTRRHWLAVKVGWLLLAALAWGGAVGALVTWWSGPRNAASLNAFNPGSFDVQGIMPAAYSLFAMALGIAAGTLIRRVLPAVGVTLGGYFAVRLVIMGWIRQHYMPPVAATHGIAQDVPPPSGASWVLAQGFRGPNGPLPLPSGDNFSVVGNGFPVRSVFDYNGLGRELSPFLLLDYAAPYAFSAGDEKRGVGAHPHKGFETVTVAYQGGEGTYLVRPPDGCPTR